MNSRYLLLGDRQPLRAPRPPKRRRPGLTADGQVDRRLYLLGLVIAIAALPFRQPLLLVIGLLILIVTGTIEIWGRYCLQYLDYKREFSEKRVLFGEEVTLSLSVRSE